jgi:hypothetical protein
MSSLLHWRSTKPTLRAIRSRTVISRVRRSCTHRAQLGAEIVLVCTLALFLTSCRQSGNVPVVAKIGVIGPFEGIGRRLGYAVLPAMESQLAHANAEHATEPYRVALVALNDDLDATGAAAQAKALVQDPDVQAVIGLWSDETARAAAPILAAAGVPLILTTPDPGVAPGAWSLCPTPKALAEELLRVAEVSGDEHLVVAGPDSTLRQALLAIRPDLPVVPGSAISPCKDGVQADCRVLYSADAVSAADDLRRWRAAGWRGELLGGPETARPWLIEQAGGAAEGTRSVTCGSLGSSLPDQDASLQGAAQLADAATKTVLSGLQQAASERKRPSREAMAESLSSVPLRPGSAWLVVRNGQWVRLPG